MKTQTALERLLVVAGIGFVAGVVAALLGPWQLAVVLAWDAAAAGFVVSVWWVVFPLTADETSALATREDPSRVAASVVLLSAAVVSLVGTALVLIKADQAMRGGRIMLTAAGILTVALSWAVVHTV